MKDLRWIGERVGVCMFAVVDAATFGVGCIDSTLLLLMPSSPGSVLAPTATVSAELRLPGVFMLLPELDACVGAADADNVEDVTTAAASAMAFALSDLLNGAGDMVSGARVLNLPPDLLVPPLAAAGSALLLSVGLPSLLSSGCFAWPEAAHAAAAAADSTATPPSPPPPTDDPGGEGHGVSGATGVLAAASDTVPVLSALEMGTSEVGFRLSFGAPCRPWSLLDDDADVLFASMVGALMSTAKMQQLWRCGGPAIAMHQW